MSKTNTSRRDRRSGYNQEIVRPLPCLVFVLPLLTLFHVGIAYYGTSLVAVLDVYRLLHYFGATTVYVAPLAIVVVLLVQHLFHRDPWQIRPKVLAGMVAESILWLLPMLAMTHLTGMALAAGARAPLEWGLEKVLTAVGAGLYEEFIFRLLLLSLVMLVFVDVFNLRKDVVMIVGVIVTAVLFSLYHFSASQNSGGVGFDWQLFTFRAMAGLYLGALYVFRGFAVAVGAHVVYDIYVFFIAA